jgi:hypothetical protein
MKQKIDDLKIVNHESGQSTIVMVLLLATVVAGLSSILPDLLTSIDRGTKLLVVKSSATLAKENVMAMLDNDAVFAATIQLPQNNSKLGCLKTAGATCTFNAGAAETISLADAEGNMVLHAPNPSHGFTAAGQPCQTFGDPSVSDNCIFRFVIQVECEGACTATTFPAGTPAVVPPGTIPILPKIRFLSSLDFKPKDGMIKAGSLNVANNTSPYQIKFQRGGKETKTIAKFCTSVNGYFDQKTQQCESALAPASFDCRNPATGGNPHSWFVGFTPTGAPKCMTDSTVALACPAGSAIVAYDEKGEFICGGF